MRDIKSCDTCKYTNCDYTTTEPCKSCVKEKPDFIGWQPQTENEPKTSLETDNVNHPSHYCTGGIECIDAIKVATAGLIGVEAVCVANVMKYTWRYKNKNGIEDLKKAQWYLNMIVEELEENEKIQS